MQGQSERLSENEAVHNAFEYKWLTDEISPLRNPVGENITYAMEKGEQVTPETDLLSWINNHALGAACYGHTNLVPSFCRTYTELTGRAVVAVHAAKGSTKISDWLVGTPIYRALIQKARGAIQKVNPSRIFFVWLQGESDALAGTSKETYKTAWKTLCKALKNDVGIEHFGIIRVGRFTNDERDLEIIAAQDEVCSENEAFSMLTTIATELNTQSDCMHPRIRGHYSATGLEQLGQSAAEGLCDLFKDSST